MSVDLSISSSEVHGALKRLAFARLVSNDANESRPLLEAVEEFLLLLEPLLGELVFAGGCATGLLISDAASGGLRVTKDVDTITEVASYREYVTGLSDRLRALGFAEDHSEGAPTCRWRHQDLILDVMPTDERVVLGFTNSWFAPAIASAVDVEMTGLRVRVITSTYFLATTLEAFRGLGNDDYRGSHDLKDLIAVVDGRPEIVEEVGNAPAAVRGFVAAEYRISSARDSSSTLFPDFCSLIPQVRDASHSFESDSRRWLGLIPEEGRRLAQRAV